MLWFVAFSQVSQISFYFLHWLRKILSMYIGDAMLMLKNHSYYLAYRYCDHGSTVFGNLNNRSPKAITREARAVSLGIFSSIVTRSCNTSSSSTRIKFFVCVKDYINNNN